MNDEPTIAEVILGTITCLSLLAVLWTLAAIL